MKFTPKKIVTAIILVLAFLFTFLMVRYNLRAGKVSSTEDLFCIGKTEITPEKRDGECSIRQKHSCTGLYGAKASLDVKVAPNFSMPCKCKDSKGIERSGMDESNESGNDISCYLY